MPTFVVGILVLVVYATGFGMGLLFKKAGVDDRDAWEREASRKRAWAVHLRFRARLRELRDLVSHMWVHDGYGTNGFRKMTIEQRHLYAKQVHQPHDLLHEWEYGSKP